MNPVTFTKLASLTFMASGLLIQAVAPRALANILMSSAALLLGGVYGVLYVVLRREEDKK